MCVGARQPTEDVGELRIAKWWDGNRYRSLSRRDGLCGVIGPGCGIAMHEINVVDQRC
jgi:hypothetical protein